MPGTVRNFLPFACLATATLVHAHHSYASFDAAQTRTLQGTVGSIDWANPHVSFQLLVSPDGASSQAWRIESSSPSILARYGWTRTTLQPGDRISVVCNPMSDGTYAGRLHTVYLVKSGKTLGTKLSESLKSTQN